MLIHSAVTGVTLIPDNGMGRAMMLLTDGAKPVPVHEYHETEDGDECYPKFLQTVFMADWDGGRWSERYALVYCGPAAPEPSRPGDACVMCHKGGAPWRIDPYARELDDEEVMIRLHDGTCAEERYAET